MTHAHLDKRRIGAAPRAALAACLTLFLLIGAFAANTGLAARALADETSPAAQGQHADDGAAPTQGQRIAVDPTGREEGFSAVLYDNTNGLPTSEANDIAETAEGFIWIGSYSGLIRYDGNSFERIDSTTGIASVVDLYVDSHDRLWIGTNDSGVAMMERGQFRIWSTAEGLQSASVRTVIEDDNGTMYVATTAGVATIAPDMSLQTISDPRLEGVYIRELRMGSDGLVYGLIQGGGLFTLKDGEIDQFVSSADIGITGVIGFLPDPEKPGYVYLGTESTQIYHGSLADGFASKSTYDIAPLSYVEHFEFIEGQLWICGGNGIGTLADQGFQMLENLPMNNSVQHMMVDYEGNLWFTSTRQGVMKIVPNQFANLYERYDLPAAVVNSTCMSDGKLFVATDAGLTVIADDGVVNSIPLTKATTASGVDLGATDLIAMLDGCRIRSIIRDSAGRLWISTWLKYGVIRYDDGEVTAFSSQDGLFSDRVRVACERRDGSMLVATTGGVNVIEHDEVTTGFGEDAGIVNDEVLSVTEAENGDIILGTDGGGIYVISDGTARHIGTQDGLSSEVVMRIKPDPAHGIYWIVASNSLAYMTSDYQVTTISKFPYSNNFDVYENSLDELWVLSSNGIYVAPVDELLANGNIDPVFYGMDNGLPCIATANSYSELTAEGDLYLAGSTGVAKVNIDAPYKDVSDLKISVPYVDADNTRIYPDANGAFSIAPTTNRLTVYSYVFNYSLLNPLVSYRLDGFEKANTTVSRSDLLPHDYTNLAGGDYEFVIQLNDAMGHGSKVTQVQIVKEKAFFEQPWFYILAALALVGIAVAAARLYTRRKMRLLEKKNRETMTLIREITEAFAKVIDMKDNYTNGHSFRVAQYTVMLARELGYDEETVERYYRIALLHDIGKIGVPSEVLNKPDKLTDEEFRAIQSHTTAGYEVLKDISIMPELAIGAQAHHERPDGKGYPNHLKGDEIPRVAQIVAVADCFDAMYSTRTYRSRMNFERAVSIIEKGSGTQLASDVVDAFLRLVAQGEFRAPDDDGGGTTENIENVEGGKDASGGEEDRPIVAAVSAEFAESADES